MAENNIEKNSNIEKINEDTVSESKVAGNSEKQEKPKTTKIVGALRVMSLY